MPWKVYREGDKFCVHKLNADDSRGRKMGCHDSMSEARAQARALYANAKEIEGIEEMDDKELDAIILDESVFEEKGFLDPFQPAGGAVSFDELDQMEEAAQITSELGELVGKFTTLASNIVYSQDEDRSKALENLVDEFVSRIEVTGSTGGDYEDEGKEVDEYKEAWTAAYVNDLPDSSFLYIEPGGKKDGEGKTAPRSLRHLPVRDAQGKPDAAHLRNAAARAGQVKLRTGKTISPAKAAGLRKRAQRLLAGVKKEQTWIEGAVEKVKEWLNIPEKKTENTSFFTWKEADGSYSWLARYSNKFRDDDNVPEIISSASHARFVELVDKGIVPLPELWLWHVKDWKFGHATAVAYDDSGYALAIGKVDDLAVAESIMNTDIDWAVSHGMPEHTIKRDEGDPTVIIEHETREISPLPRWAAANKMTDFVIFHKEIELDEEDQMAIPQAKRQSLIDNGVPESVLGALERKNAEDAAKATDEGIESKEKEAAPVENLVVTLSVDGIPAEETETPQVEETPAEQAESVEPAPAQVAPITREEIAEAIIAVFGDMVSGLQGEIKELKGQIEALKEEHDKELINATPAASLGSLLASRRAVGAKETALSENDPLLAKGPVEKEHETPQIFSVPFIDKMVKSGK